MMMWRAMMMMMMKMTGPLWRRHGGPTMRTCSIRCG
jgi:hypothetical protein